MRVRKTAVLAVALALLLAPRASPAETDTESQALASAQAWLALVDRGDYPGSWTYASPLFQSAMPTANWVSALSTVRTPLGKMIRRAPTSARYTTTLPGMPDGHYVVVQFATSFEHKASAVETVTAIRDYDGYWRVGGYFIK